MRLRGLCALPRRSGAGVRRARARARPSVRPSVRWIRRRALAPPCNTARADGACCCSSRSHERVVRSAIQRFWRAHEKRNNEGRIGGGVDQTGGMQRKLSSGLTPIGKVKAGQA